MPEQDSNTVEIPLTRGKVALVDAADAPFVLRYKWQAIVNTSGCWYAQRAARAACGKKTTLLLHRAILDLPKGIEADHKNRDGLDCRRTNLRPATPRQNCQSRRPCNKYGFKGVVCDPRQKTRQWRVNMGGQKRRITLGSFDTAEEAARAYDAKAKEMYGEFAWLNFPEVDQPQPELPEVIEVGDREDER